MLISTTTLLLAAIISSIIAGFIPRFSINYISIILGVAIALIIPLNKLIAPFQSEVFMYFVAPLIYFEGQATHINLVGRNFRQIVEMAVILVVIGMVASGIAVKLIGIPLALAFLIAALSTPTDATATESVSEGLIMPERQERLLKMESLFNDASGIILVSAMALWVSNGQFDYQQTFFAFLQSAGGGVLVGIVAALVMINFRRFISHFNSNAYNAQNLLFILTPLFVYFIAEELEVSGIIAVVCAGLMQNSESSSSRFNAPRQFYNGISLMNLFQEILNNIVFLILGILTVRIIKEDLIAGTNSFSWVAIGCALYLVNLLARFIYGLITKQGWHGSLVFALGGVHGAVTLALVYSIASSVSDVQFDLVILSEMLMVVLSMIVPSIIFQFILPHDLPTHDVNDATNRLRKEMVQHGLDAIEKIYIPAEVRERVSYDIQDQKGANTFKDFWQRWLLATRRPTLDSQEQELEQRALLWAFQAERSYLDMVSQKEHLRPYVYDLYNEVLLAEATLLDPRNSMRD